MGARTKKPNMGIRDLTKRAESANELAKHISLLDKYLGLHLLIVGNLIAGTR
jgi:hypothetical protein